jgi:hypothetical protein
MQFSPIRRVGAVAFILAPGCRHPGRPLVPAVITCTSFGIVADDTTTGGQHIARIQSFCRDSLGHPVPVPGDSMVKLRPTGA